MSIMDKFFAINIRKYLALGDDREAGEPALVKLLSGFFCPKNPDVERFLKAWMTIEKAQYMLGGMVTFLEAENEEKLLSFYRNNRFSQFDTRQTVSAIAESQELVQLLRLL